MTLLDPTFDDRDGQIWFDGKLVPWRDAQVHVLTHALHYASAVFEGMRCYGGAIFARSQHSARLIESAKLLGFDLPWTVAEIDAACDATVAANGLVDCYVRPIAWRGSEQMGIAAQRTKPHLAVAAWEWGAYFGEEALTKGLRLDIARWRRPAPYTAPTRSKAASRTSSLPVSAPVCEAAAMAPTLVRPALMTRIGLDSATSRAAERKARALPTDSM